MKGTLHQPPPDCQRFLSTFCLQGRKNRAWFKSGPDLAAAYPNASNSATIGADQISSDQLKRSPNSRIPTLLLGEAIRQIEHY